MKSNYPKAYGTWAGNPRGNKPDFTRCCESVSTGIGIHSHQCARLKGHGPNGDYCKQHDPVARKVKYDARSKAWNEKWAREREQSRFNSASRNFYAVLKQIADGHNDARGLAKETIDKFNRKETDDDDFES